jgi:hypothetical protein
MKILVLKVVGLLILWFLVLGNPSLALAQDKWQVKSIDTQIVSKCWQNVPQQNIDEQMALIKSLGANYVAIGTPYDRPAEMKKWADSAHAAGLKVWYRSHWLNWEGDEGKPKNMSPEQYLKKTQNFIISHPNLFKEGDAFTMNVEAENVGVGQGKPFTDWDQYREFLNDEVDLANYSFRLIGLGDKVHTNWLSMNGWIVDNVLNQKLVNKMGVLTVDHYPDQDGKTKVSASKMAQDMSNDLDRYYQKWNVPILIGEWGYYVHGNVPDGEQSTFIQNIFGVFARKPYLYGINYWDHMGNQTRLIIDKNGSNLRLRPGAYVLRKFFKTN